MIKNTILKIVLDGPKTMEEIYDAVTKIEEVQKHSIRARVYELLRDHRIKKLCRAIYASSNCLLIHGSGRGLEGIGDKSVDFICDDHPYDIKASNNGGSRHFATYNCFRYEQEDFNQMARVLKPGCFMVQFLPTENGDNWKYRHEIFEMAEKAGFEFYAKVPWKKGDFISNCGRTSKNTEDVVIFTLGKARNLRPDAKKDKAEPAVKHYMSGATKMLPTVWDFAKPKEMIHQAEKPVELLEAILECFTLPDETVIDQFAGSGVTGEACINMDRKCILYEIDESFVDKIQERIKLAESKKLESIATN